MSDIRSLAAVVGWMFLNESASYQICKIMAAEFLNAKLNKHGHLPETRCNAMNCDCGKAGEKKWATSLFIACDILLLWIRYFKLLIKRFQIFIRGGQESGWLKCITITFDDIIIPRWLRFMSCSRSTPQVKAVNCGWWNCNFVHMSLFIQYYRPIKARPLRRLPEVFMWTSLFGFHASRAVLLVHLRYLSPCRRYDFVLTEWPVWKEIDWWHWFLIKSQSCGVNGGTHSSNGDLIEGKLIF